jgi:hypothetical protein
MTDDENHTGGPNTSPGNVLAYLRDELDDPVTQQFLDQAFAAADDTRESIGIPPNDGLTLPTDRARKLLSTMWSRLIEATAGHICEHLAARPLQPTVLLREERRQVCLACAEDVTVTFGAKGSPYECPGCGRVEKLTTKGDPSGSLWADVRQHMHYVAVVLLCGDCCRIADECEDLPPAIRDGVVELRRQARTRRARQD